MTLQPSLLVAVALGGAVGAVARYLVTTAVGQWLGHGVPWGTMAVNVAGSVLMGVLIEVSALAWSPSPAMRAFLAVGLLGAFTTFSTFSLDAVMLIQRGQTAAASLYVLGSVALCLAGLVLGLKLTKLILP